MILTVPFDEFPAAVKRASGSEVYVSEHGENTLVTAFDKSRGAILLATSEQPVEAVKAQLESLRLEVFSGRWSAESIELESRNGAHDAYIAAVAYRSRDSMPGLWMDAFGTVPTPQIVLRSMYDEFRENDEIGDVSYE